MLRVWSRRWLIGVLAPLCYLIIFPRSTGRELVFETQWVADLGQDRPRADAMSGVDDALFFRIGDRFGYVGSDGRRFFEGNVLFDVALSHRGFINYSKIARNLVFRNPGGILVANLETIGYPVLGAEGKRVVVLSPDGGGLTEFTLQGELVWERQMGSLITCLDIQGDALGVGLLDGSFHLISETGADQFTTDASAESRIPVTVGCAVSRTNSYAVVSGLDPQRLVIIQKRKNGKYDLSSFELLTDHRSETIVTFSEGGRFVYVPGPGAIIAFDRHDSTISRTAIPGQIVRVDAAAGTYSVLSRQDHQSWIYVATSSGAPVFQASLPSGTSFLRQRARSLIIGMENTVIRADIRRK